MISDNISRVQDFLGRRILIENVSSYVEFAHSEMPEWEFVKQIVERGDCGLLLDINNVFVSSFNHRFDPLEYLRHMPAERVAQIHLAGHSDHGGYLVDTHDQPVRDEVWALYQWSVEHFGSVRVMIERDGNIPAWTELENELKNLRRIHDEMVANTLSQRIPAAI